MTLSQICKICAGVPGSVLRNERKKIREQRQLFPLLSHSGPCQVQASHIHTPTLSDREGTTWKLQDTQLNPIIQGKQSRLDVSARRGSHKPPVQVFTPGFLCALKTTPSCLVPTPIPSLSHQCSLTEGLSFGSLPAHGLRTIRAGLALGFHLTLQASILWQTWQLLTMSQEWKGIKYAMGPLWPKRTRGAIKLLGSWL